jgi:hypothetical protein
MSKPIGTPTENQAPELVEEHRQGTPLQPQPPTIIRIVRRNDQQNWRTYRTDCY